MSHSIPMIDLDALEQAASRAAIDCACREWGFFQLRGHGIPAADCDGILALARRLFALPAAQKQAMLRSAGNPWGFFDRELTKNQRDWKEIYDFGPDDGGRLPPRWPSGPLRARFEPAMRRHHAACRELALRLLGVIASNLGMSPAALDRDFGAAHTSFLRLNYYPKCPAGGRIDAALGVGEHTDSGALTLLLQDSQPGLQVFHRGSWQLVEPCAGALVVNIGDIVQVWSNDRYRAALHRVVTNPRCDRYTVPFFLNPSYDAQYAPLPTMITSGQPARYRPISWREFRRLRAAGDYADLGEEVQIAHYRQATGDPT
jgi:isopenicillin N synthase-like dioxygenase